MLTLICTSLWYMVALKIKPWWWIIVWSFWQLRANLFQTFQWSNEDTHSPEKSISPSEGPHDLEEVATMERSYDCFCGHSGAQVKAVKSRAGLSVRTWDFSRSSVSFSFWIQTCQLWKEKFSCPFLRFLGNLFAEKHVFIEPLCWP